MIGSRTPTNRASWGIVFGCSGSDGRSDGLGEGEPPALATKRVRELGVGALRALRAAGNAGSLEAANSEHKKWANEDLPTPCRAPDGAWCWSDS